MRVTWVHPSWRDLVVEALAASAPERQAFLRAAQLPGLELALSAGGGATGERALPLVVTDDDWDALGDAVHRLAREAASDDARRLLGALDAALASTDDDAVRGELHALAELALTTIVRRATAWDPELLERWLALAQRLPQPPQPPDLAETWRERRPPAVDPDDPATGAAFDAWLGVVEVLATWHPDGADVTPHVAADRPLLLAFLRGLESRFRVLREPDASALRRIGRLDGELAPRAMRLLHDRAAPAPRLPPEPDPLPTPLPGRADARRVRRILLDL